MGKLLTYLDMLQSLLSSPNRTRINCPSLLFFGKPGKVDAPAIRLL